MEKELKNENIKRVFYTTLDYLSKKTREKMKEEPDTNKMGLSIYTYEYGHILVLPEEPAYVLKTAAKNFPGDLLECMVVAKERCCDWIVFDEEGNEDEELASRLRHVS